MGWPSTTLSSNLRDLLLLHFPKNGYGTWKRNWVHSRSGWTPRPNSPWR